MSGKEVPRAGLPKAALAGKISNAEGARAIHVSLRQFYRVKVRFAAAGVDGLLHRLRGRQVVRTRRTPETQMGALVQLDASSCRPARSGSAP